MNKTLTRLFTVALLMMVSMGAWAEVKVLFGEKGTELQSGKDGTITLSQKELTGGTIIISQEEQKDGTSKVTFAVTPDKNYKLAENGLEVYAVIPPGISSTRGLEVSTALTLKSEDFKDETSKRTYTTTIDSKLALWLKSVNILPQKRDGAKSTTHPYAGVWYMTVKKNTAYYMVPAANPQVTMANHVNEDAFFSSNYSTQAGDPEKPFVTTYQTSGDLNSIWIFVPVSGENNFYYIVHAKTGKYVKYQQYLSGDNARRKFVHLETMVTPGETEKFEITALGVGVKIKPKNNTMYFNVAGDNQPRYNGGTSNLYYSGMVGGMTGTDDNSQFNLTDASTSTDLTPVISDVNETDNTFTITSPAAAFSTIRYTTDGSTTPDASTDTNATSGSPITITGNWSVQAVGVFKSFVTPVAGPKELAPTGCAKPIITYDHATSTVSITCPTADASIYYTTEGSDPTNGTQYSSAFSVSDGMIIKAIAKKSGLSNSDIASLTIVLNPTINIDGGPFTYNGTQQQPAVTVKKGDDVINPTEYQVSYGNNIDVGNSATVTISDAEGGEYYVAGSATFTISPMSIGSGSNPVSGITIDVLENGGTYSVIVKHNDKTLIEGTDYEWSGGTVGEDYVVTVTGKGNYSGTAQATYVAATPGYYVLHQNGKGYLKVSGAGVNLENDGTFQSGNLFDKGNCIWYMTPEGYLQNEYFYLNAANNNTLYLSVNPVTRWRSEDVTGENTYGKKHLKINNGTEDLYLCNDNNSITLNNNPSAYYSACPVDVEEVENSWAGPTAENLTVQSPQLVTYLRAYFTQKIKYTFHNDAGAEVKSTDGKHERRVYATIAYKEGGNNKGTDWDIDESGILYNKKASGDVEFTATYNILPADPVVQAAHSTPASIDIKYKVTKKPLTFTENMDYLLYSISGGDSYRYPYDDGIADGGAVKPDGKGGTGDTSVLTDPDTDKNLQISWKITADEEGFYTFQNSSTGKYLYYDETAHTSSDFGVLRLSTAPTGNSAKFRLYKTSDTNYSECYYLIPYSKLFAVYKSNAVADGLYVALNNKDYTGDTPVISLSKPNANSTWCIYKYEAEYRIREDFTITGPSSAEAVGNYNITSEGWYGRYIKQSPGNGSGQRGLVIKGTYKDNVDYIWTVTGLGNYIDISGATNTDGTWSITTNGNANNRKLVVNVTSLPVSTTSGVITLKLSGYSAPNTNVRTSSEKTFAFTILGDGAISFTDITSLAGITSSSGVYRLVGGESSDFAYSATNKPGVTSFSGILDGNNQTISGLSAPLFDNMSNGTVRNVNLSGVSISSHSGPTGAIAGTADGGSRIYNVGILDGEVGSSDNVCGGLVGKLDGSARVINCFSYATITGGTTVGGIVGNNTYASKSNDMRTMVMNCMFYGDITGGNSKAPIYNGQIITNRSDENGVGNFNYFWAGASYVQGRDIDVYNCALSAETRFLQRFEFFRHLLNSNRALAAWWATGSRDKKNEMLKWVLEPSQIGTATPYPILKPFGKYPSVVNIDADHAEDFSADADTKKTQYNQGRKFGTLTINIQNATSGSGSDAPSGANITTTTVYPNITDKDPVHFNFNYYKVQLPYYNDVGTKNYTDNKVVTGWKIVTISGGTHSFSDSGSDATATVDENGNISLTTPYNFADRKSTDKDNFDVSGRVFSQGAYFDVPEGVSSITIEPYWGKCVYVSDQYPDVVYNQGMSTAANVTTVGGGQRYTNGTAYDINGSSQKVYTTMGNAVTALNPSGSVYDNAIVLVGNVHSLDLSNKTDSKPYTIMSIDLDSDNEPDYSYILRFNNRNRVHPVRIDFLNVIGLGMAQKSKGGTGTYNFGIMQPFGWFECTNTGLFRVTQLEYDYKGQNGNAPRLESPMILQGGVIEQWVTVGGKEAAHKEAKSVTYYHVGGNVWFKEFHIGVHQDKTEDEFSSPHPPISVTGGDFDEFYLTGMYNTPNTNYPDNAECYINGGRFGKVAGTGMQGLGNAGGAGETGGPAETGNIIWQIDHADIDEFYAGGINAAHIATGNIRTVISNSRVDQFCGGPKFGNMTSTKTVVTNATNCTFRTFFGAGYGGNSYNRKYPFNRNDVQNTDWNGWVSSEYTNKYDSNYGGVETRIDYQFIPMSSNTSNVARLYVDYVNFSLATTHDVTSKLTDCTITTSTLGRLELFSQSVGNFYGGGSLGMVDGPVKSTLTNCTVEGNVFGGGYSATLPTVAVMNNSFKTEPHYDSNLGAYLDAVLPTTVPYTWEHATEAEFSSKQIDTDNHILYTTETLTGLGAVTGNVTLTIDGYTTLTNGKRMSVSHSVYGGGEESNVAGNTQVNITGGTISENVFGGGKGEADEFLCSKAMVGRNDDGRCEDPGSDTNKDKGTKVTISNGTVNGNVYGGGEVGRVEWNTQVKIGVGTGNGPFAPVINGSVFGAGKGKETHGYGALVRGNSSVTIGGSAKVRENVYGGGEQATVGRYWVKNVPTTLCENDENEKVIPTPSGDLPDEMPYKTRRGGKSTVIVQGSAQIGPDDGATSTVGHVFGAGKGVTPAYVHEGDKANWSKRMVDYNSDKHTGESGTTWDYYPDDHNYVWEYFATEAKYLEFLQTLALVTGTDVTINGATVKGNVYGGSESGFVQDDTYVKIQSGTIGTADSYGYVFGGGKGLPQFSEAGLVKGNASVEVSDGTIQRNVYGGGELGHVGTFTETADGRYIKKKDINGVDMNTGLCTVSITGGKIGPDNNSNQEIGNVFGAGKGKDDTFKCEKAMTMEARVSVGGGTVNGNVYGGGEVGRVEYDTEVTIGRKSNETAGSGTGTPIINGSVFGAGRGVATHGYSALVRGNTRVDVEGAAGAMVNGDVFGGGEIASVGRYGLNTENMPNILLGGGICEVNVQGNVVITGDVFGAGQGVDPSTFNKTGSDKTKLSRRMTVYNDDDFPENAKISAETGTASGTTHAGTTWEYYDESVMPKLVWEYYQDAGAYSDYLQTLALATAPNVTIEGNAQVKGSVFGGGELGLTKGSVTVTINGGTIGTLDTDGNPVVGTGDVYGGGSLADTNTTSKVGVLDGDGVPLNTNDQPYQKGDTYKTNTVHPTTIVRLHGGLIYGDAYGGGLGRLSSTGVTAVAALVVGDVLVDLNGVTTVTTDADGGRTWTDNTGTVIDHSKKGCIVRRVFGCNNLNGTPQKNVTVHVYATQNANATQIANTAAVEASGDNPAVPEVTNAKVKGRYDVKDVYGGGNLAAYNPVAPNTAETSQPNTSPNGSRTQVIIDGCSLTSIQTVYGGGNAAAVPETNVDIKGAYEIGYLFGGGNGKDDIAPGVPNPGADIGTLDHGTTTYGTGNANTLMVGGLIHEAYGGSNTKGVIKGSINQKSDPKSPEDEDYRCDLVVEKIVGAGKYADIDGDVNMTLSCQPSSKVDLLFAGADEANVNGNITLNITNGHFGNVFGGNNLGGAIKGKITVNVEETGCQPIKIDNLYLGSNEAAYSVFGYYESDDLHPVTGKKILKPRTAEMHAITDPEAEGYKAPVTNPATDETHTFPYAQPELNIISCTYIGNVFGGGYGEGAVMHADPTVNINMVKGDYGDTAVPAMMTELGLDNTENTEHLGIIRNVYGGGNAADIIGNPTVNIGTESQAKGAYIVGNVYGGGKGASDTYACEKAMIGKDGDGIDNPDGGTTVRIYKGLVRGNVYGGGEIGRVEKNTAVTIGAENGTDVPVVMGDVFGAGKGLETHGYAALVRGNPTVTIRGKAKVLHSVYGGGQIASVARYQLVDGVPVALAETNGKKSGYCTVNILGDAVIGPDKKMVMHHMDEQGNTVLGDDGFPLLPDDAGHVFAAGKGVLPIVYDYAKPTSTVQANYHTEQYEIDEHMPKRMMLYKNKKSQYWEYADSDFDPTGVDEGDLANQDVWEYFPSEKDYFDFVETLALATQTNVTISGNAFVKGSVYGGSENGLVQYNTNVMIEGECQIGCGKNTTDRHPAAVWGDNYTVPDGTDLECASWDYDSSSGAPYDPNAKYLYNGKYYYDENHENDAAGGSIVGKDGHTYYGNVFGGGSGSVPYFDTNQGRSRYVMSAGWVKGNTNVTINGGHILTNVYGGNEATNVDGTATVTMNGGTVGVPRTLAQIDAHPVTCYLFGAGKGDQRVFFNKDTNVKDVVVNITGGRIYGSVFGGGEDGHVLRNVTMTIGTQTTTGEGAQATTTTSGPKIGTWGTSYVDGNVFGGGRGFGGDAYTAGNVAGSVTMNINGGEMLGSIYGGGRLGSVGYGLFDATTNGQPTPGYGEMREDNDTEEGFVPEGGFTHGRGHIDITISGGTIGNDYEYIVPNSSNIPNTITEADISKWTTTTGGEWDKWKAHNHIPKTEFDASGRLIHTKGGNVFAGGMGRFHQLDGTTYISAVDWWKLGCVKSTKLTITGGTIKSNVYGGGELGQVVGHHTFKNDANEDVDVSTEISISGNDTKIGTEVKNGETTEYTFGSVFGSGYGSLIDKIVVNNGTSDVTSYPRFIAGLVKEDTKIDMQGGAVKASIYGGGEMASVGESTTSGETTTVTGSTYVTVSGGTVGIAPIEVSGIKRYFGGAKMGNVYGGGSGDNGTVRSGKIFKNTNVNISGGTIYHNVYGGGAYGTVGDFEYTDTNNKVTGVEKLATENTGVANVTITGGTIGYDGRENGMVFGSSRGDIAEPGARDDFCAWVYDTHVTIGSLAEGTEGQEGYVPATAPQIKGSVYGSGENGHTFNDTEVVIHSGTVGIEDGWPINGLSGANYPTRGNVYGGGCGTDTYEVDHDNNPNTPSKQYFNRLSGIVRGNTSVTMDGGHVVRSIYGGGAMGSVGVFTRSDDDDDGIHLPGSITGISFGGKCTVNISGGKVGPATLTMPMNAGMVFGAGRGEVHDVAVYPNLERVVYVNETDVTISGTAFVKGSVYGGSESGHVFGNTHVTIDGDCQIGCGYDKTFNNGEGKEPGKDLDRVYTTSEWAYDVTSDNTKFLYECNSWPFTEPYTPYDKFADDNGKYPNGENADNAHQKGTDGHTFYGNVFGGGSGFEPYAPGKWLPTAGWVQGNTLVEIKGGHILTSVYGGNEMSDVGSGGVQKMTDLNNETTDMFYDITKPGGKCTVKMSGGTLGVPRTLAQIAAHPLTCYLFGAGKGDQRIFFNKTTNVKEVEIEISGGRIYGSVFGGGEDGHVMRDVKMTIKDGSTTTGEGEQAVTTTTSPIIGTWGTSYVDGNVFGGGRGFSGEALTAGNVGGSVNIDIRGGKMLGSIYGGGRLGSVGYGLYLVDEEIGEVKPYGVLLDDNVDDRGNPVEDFNRGYITINISGGTIGNDIEYKYNPTNDDKLKMPTTQFDYQNHLTYTRGGNVFTGCMGRLYALDNRTLLPLWTKLGRCRQTELNITGGTIKSNVYGGAELGFVQKDATVSITGGTVGTKVVDSTDETNYYYYGSVFGSGKGSNDAITYPEGTAEADKTDISEAGTVEGNVMVELNKGVAEDAKGGVVHKIFGCNDMNGTPKGTVTVNIYATQKEGANNIRTKAPKAVSAEAGTYDVEAVYGGGNQAAFMPADDSGTTRVNIYGCGYTSIQQVYGGGNAASTPSTHVDVYETYEIDEVFGGGNGKDVLPNGYPNPGANVGYKNYTIYEGEGDQKVAKDDPEYDTKAERTAEGSAVVYGSGDANVTIHGGTVHRVYGGSNTKGNVRISAVTMLEDESGCTFDVDEAYGGGKSAPMDAEAKLQMACIPGLKTAYGGAQNAEIEGDVELTITNGTYDRVFGGNNVSGYIKGKITVNIEETGCKPLLIGQLYGGGNQAPYTPTTENGIRDGITLNVRSFTSIGDIYGGGYGESAEVTADTHVNINVSEGKYVDGTYKYKDGKNVNNFTGEREISFTEYLREYNPTAGEWDFQYEEDGTTRKTEEKNVKVYLPPFTPGKIGGINNVFGGGNAAKVKGNTNVYIGTKATQVFVSPSTKTVTTGEGDAQTTSVVNTTDEERTVDVKGADIRGNVYGGGNNAEVTGNTNVVIGKEAQ